MIDVKFSKESVLGVADDITPLLDMHYAELTLNKDVVRLNPDWPQYVALEEQGRVHVFTIRESGALIGYAAFFLAPHIHYKDLLVATNDLIFLLPECRRGGVGRKFIAFCEERMRELGANKVTFHIKKHLDWSPMLYRDGYEQEEVIMGKVF